MFGLIMSKSALALVMPQKTREKTLADNIRTKRKPNNNNNNTKTDKFKFICQIEKELHQLM